MSNEQHAYVNHLFTTARRAVPKSDHTATRPSFLVLNHSSSSISKVSFPVVPGSAHSLVFKNLSRIVLRSRSSTVATPA
jgi:hypothetical protein